MKHVDILIQNYKNLIGNFVGDFSFTFGECFELKDFLDEIYDISEIPDKIIFVRFILRQMQKEHFNACHTINCNIENLKRTKNNGSKKSFKETINDYNFVKCELEEMIPTVEDELKNLMKLINTKDQQIIIDKFIKSENSINNPINNNYRKIQWLQDETLIIYLFEKLYSVACISSSDLEYSIDSLKRTSLMKRGNLSKGKTYYNRVQIY